MIRVVILCAAVLTIGGFVVDQTARSSWRQASSSEIGNVKGGGPCYQFSSFTCGQAPVTCDTGNQCTNYGTVPLPLYKCGNPPLNGRSRLSQQGYITIPSGQGYHQLTTYDGFCNMIWCCDCDDDHFCTDDQIGAPACTFTDTGAWYSYTNPFVNQSIPNAETWGCE